MTEQRSAPRECVQLAYEVDLYGARRTVTLPFVVAVIADLHAESTVSLWAEPLADRKFRHIDVDARDDHIARMRPAVQIVGPDGGLTRLEFESLADFAPQSIAERHPAAHDLLERRTLLAELHGRLLAHANLVAAVGAWLASPPQDGTTPPSWLAQEDEQLEQATARHLLLLDEARREALAQAGDPVGALHARILALDAEIGRHVTQVLHDPAFRRLEGAWRGVDHLLHQLDPPESGRVRVLSLRRAELAQVLHDSEDPLGKRLADEEFALFGGQPAGLWVLGEEFTQRPADVALLRTGARMAARADALLLAAAAPALLDAEAHAGVAPARGAKLQRLPEYTAWRELRADPAALHLALVVPRAAARERHTLAGLGYGEFRYVEPPADADQAPWMSGAYALAAAVLRTQLRDGWPAALDTAPGPVALPALPAWTGVDAGGRLRLATPLDAEFDAAAAGGLGAFGLVVLGREPGTTAARLLAAPALHAVGPASDDGVRARAELAVGLALGQLARWLRCSVRDREGRWADLPRFVADLRAQLADLTTSGAAADDPEGDEAPARPPLLAAAEVLAIRGASRDPETPARGRFTIDLELRPAHGFARALPALPIALDVELWLRDEVDWSWPRG